VERCWDLGAIAGRHRAFTATTGRRAAALRRQLRKRAISDAACFAEKILLVHEYRKFLFVDPGLPAALLPADWPGQAAARLFRDVYQMLAGPAARFFEAAFEPPPGPPGGASSP
jgi:phenylacetic acid degradation operon negative regulatory protein